MGHMVQNQTNLEFEILLQLAGEKAHLREIARAVHAPHSTVLRRLDRLLAENILDCASVGKNKVFSIKNNLKARTYLLMAEKYKLIKLIAKYPKLGPILQDLLSTAQSPLILLFGSHAKFIAKEDSDIDIYIQTDDAGVKKRQTRSTQSSASTSGHLTPNPLL